MYFCLMIIITGAAGFIGSCLVSKLNSLGKENLILVRLGHSKGPKGKKGDPFTPDIYTYMDAALEINKNVSTP